MSNLAFIRKERLQATQAEIAEACGVVQATVSKWESDELEPSRSDLSKIRLFAKSRGVDLTADELIGEATA